MRQNDASNFTSVSSVIKKCFVANSKKCRKYAFLGCPARLLPGVHFSLDVLPSWADRGSCAHKCVCSNFRTVTRNAVNKSVWRKKDCFWLPLNKHAMNIWLSSLRIRAHLSWRTRKRLHVLYVLRTYSTCSYPGYQDTTTYAALCDLPSPWYLISNFDLHFCLFTLLKICCLHSR